MNADRQLEDTAPGLPRHKKVIFLDVDGVLNSYRNIVADGGFPFPKNSQMADNPKHREENLDRLAVGMIRKLCKEFDAVVVLSSTWRMYVDAVEFGRRWDLPIVAGTNPNVSKPGSIKEYLVLHPEIENYIVIDDDEMHVGNRQIWTDITEGFTYKNFELATKKLAMAEGMGAPLGATR
jgi:hypothetical protein